MANQDAPFGLRYVRNLQGNYNSSGQSRYRITTADQLTLPTYIKVTLSLRTQLVLLLGLLEQMVVALQAPSS